MHYVIEHQKPYGTVVGRTEHTSARCALQRYHECVLVPGSTVFILVDGVELTADELKKDIG